MKIFLNQEELKQAVKDYIGRKLASDPVYPAEPQIQSIKIKRRTSSEEATGITIDIKE